MSRKRKLGFIVATFLFLYSVSVVNAQQKKMPNAPAPTPTHTTILRPTEITVDMIDRARRNCVNIMVGGQSNGTGFFVDALHIVTCWHVIGSFDPSTLKFTYQDGITIKLQAKLFDDELIDMKLVDIPRTAADIEPLRYDFAILELAHRPTATIKPNPISPGISSLKVGTPVIFSGYPLGVPMMMTLRGYICGTGNVATTGGLCNAIAIQAPTNFGNSGGALIAADGSVIGIITLRMGSLPPELMEQSKTIKAIREKGLTFKAGEIDVFKLQSDLVDSVQKYINPGIGYAVSSEYLANYLKYGRGLPPVEDPIRTNTVK